MRCLFSVREKVCSSAIILSAPPPFFVFIFLLGFFECKHDELAVVLPFQWFVLQTKFSASVFIQLSAPAEAFQTKVRVSDTFTAADTCRDVDTTAASRYISKVLHMSVTVVNSACQVGGRGQKKRGRR